MKRNLMSFICVAVLLCGVLVTQGCMDAHQLEPGTGAQTSFLKNDTPAEEKAAVRETKSASEVAADLENIVQTSMSENGIDPASVGIVVHDFVTDATCSVNADSYFTAASTYKLPLAMLYYEKLAKGSLTADEGITYGADDYEEGGSIGASYLPGDVIPLDTLLNAMILESDNTAGHILSNRLGGWLAFKDAISAYSLRTIHADDAQYYSYDNVLTAAYMNDVLEHLYNNTDTYEGLIEDLTVARPDDYLNGTLGGTQMAQKYGQYEMAENAVGLSTSGRPYSIVVYTQLGETGRQWMGALNAEIWHYFATLEKEEGATTNHIEKIATRASETVQVEGDALRS